MKALLLYDPLLQYLCQVNRLARSGAPLSYGDVRGKIMALLSAIDQKANDDLSLQDHVRQLKTPVNYFVDDVIAQNPRLSFAKRWNTERLGYAKDGLAGDEAFFTNHLDKELQQPPSKALAERLLVYYVCLGLGFQGYFFNDPERLRNYVRRITAAIRPWLVESTVEKLMPQAYQHTDTRDFVRPPELRSSILFAGIISLLLAGLPIYAFLAKGLVEKLDNQIHLREINESHQGAALLLKK
ncbi:DotU family type IV/VI secretion system protein [Prosthecobacter sp. SYSU 5D2]|uniref:DotU family type IV/VI secretion system protein n=1 Tax=Prosthecobacter sp. SYSU 5D2 TaxID=3134134 RepID=UPI0031FEEEA2